MIVLDASVMIAYLAAEDPHHPAARSVFIDDDEFGVHTITLAEALVRGERERRAEEVAARFETLGVREFPRQPGEARSLARLRVETRLKLPDCCPLLVAEVGGWPLATFDARLASTARSRGVDVVS